MTRAPLRTLLMLSLALGASAGALAAALRAAPYVGAVSADAAGRVLFADRADNPAYIASVTKLMTALLVLEDVRAGKYAFADRVAATPDVRLCEASWIGLKSGESMTVKDLLYALMVESANDAAIVLGVHAAGSFAGFVERMNARAAALGMSATRYYNPNGLPPDARRRYPWKQYNVSTAADQLKLALALLKLPEILEFTSVKTCDLIRTDGGYRVAVTRRVNEPLKVTELAAGESMVKHLQNHNNIMRTDKLKIVNDDGREAVDGFKTGYIGAGGSSIVLTGTRRGKRAVVVVLGSDSELNAKRQILHKSSEVRDEHARRLLEDALGAISW